MPPKNRIFLSDAQKYEFSLYARDNKRTRAQYANWIEERRGLRVDEYKNPADKG
jgi:hypothetical protein